MQKLSVLNLLRGVFVKVELFQINLYTIRSQILEFQNVLSLSIFAVHKEASLRDVHDDGLPCHHNQSGTDNWISVWVHLDPDILNIIIPRFRH